MTRKELEKIVAEKASITKKDAESAIKATLEAITECVKNGDKLQLTGWGTFYLKETAEREGRNPSTGEILKIEAKKSLAFKAGSETKNL